MIITREHFEYLVTQRGEVSDERGNFSKWKIAYEKSLNDILDTIVPVLPARFDSVLDIGSGLGGIDVLLSLHCDGDRDVTLVDGEADKPDVRWSFQTHSSRVIAEDFQRRNGVSKLTYLNPNQFRAGEQFRKQDLIVSFAAYGFHIHPGDYMAEVRKACHKDTVLIFEVRRTKPEWLRLFVEQFGEPKVLYRAEKLSRLAFNVKP